MTRVPLSSGNGLIIDSVFAEDGVHDDIPAAEVVYGEEIIYCRVVRSVIAGNVRVHHSESVLSEDRLGFRGEEEADKGFGDFPRAVFIHRGIYDRDWVSGSEWSSLE